MTKPPYGGSAGAPSSTEFGAPTISGSPSTERPDSDRTQDNPRTERIGVAEHQPPAAHPAASAGGGPRAAGTATALPASADRTGGAGIQNLPANARTRGPRRARLQIRHVSPVTVLKFSCVLAIALFFVWLIVIGVLYGVLDASGAIKHVNDTYITINGAGSKAPITAGIVFGGAAIVGVANIVLFIALTTIGAVIYNLCADLVGGVEITLSER